MDGLYKPVKLNIKVHAHTHVHIVLERGNHSFHQILQQFMNPPCPQLRMNTYLLHNIQRWSFHLSATILGILKEAEVFIECLH